MRRSLQRLTLATAVPLLVIGLSACTTTTSPEPTASLATTPTAVVPTEPSSIETPAATAVAATCDDVLTAAAYAELETDGLTPRDPIAHTPFMGAMLDTGALGCRWGKEATDITLDIARLPVDDASWPEWETALAAAGYTKTDDPVPGAYTGPEEPGSGVSPVVVRSADAITYVSAPTFAAMIAVADR